MHCSFDETASCSLKRIAWQDGNMPWRSVNLPELSMFCAEDLQLTSQRLTACNAAALSFLVKSKR